jgi:tetratricopeptide (TPR) repeat protein
VPGGGATDAAPPSRVPARSPRRLIALLLLGGVAIGLAVWARQALGPDRYRSYTRPQLEAVLARRPNDAAALHRLGLLYTEERRFTEARRTLERAYQAAPGNGRIANALGEACAHQHDFPAARVYFEQATQLNPRLAIAHRNLGDMWGVAGDYVQAARAYQRALALEPKNVETLVALGSAYADAQNMGRAVATFEQAIALAPDSAAGYQGLGRAHLRARRYREAREALAHAARLDPNDPHTAGFLALAYAEQITTPEEAAAAEREIDHAASLGYQAAELDLARGLVALYRKQYPAAIAALEAATRKDPGAENMRYRLAQAYLAAGRRAEGEQQMARYQQLVRTRPELQRLRRAVQEQPDDLESRRRLARLCLETGRHSEAVRHFQILTRLRASDRAAWRGLAAAAEAAGNASLAAQARANLRQHEASPAASPTAAQDGQVSGG